MRRTPPSRLVWVAVLVANLAFLALRLAESQGATVPPVPVLSSVVVLVIAAIVGRLGWRVRQFLEGRRPGLDPLVAARTVALGTASAYTGALLTGWYAGQVLLVIGDLEIEGRRAVATAAGVALVCTVVLAVVGLLVERWCEIRPPEDGASAGDPRGTAPSGSPV